MKRCIKENLLFIFGTFLVAFGLNVFLVPFNLSSGGIGTIGVIFLHYFNIPLSITNLLMNIILFGLGIKLLNKNSILKTVFGIIALSVFLQITSNIPKFNEDIFLSMVIGGVLDGIGMGLILSVDGSTGGIDFLALMVKKRYAHISLASFMFWVNGILFIVSGVAFKSYSVTFYSIIAMYISSKVTNYVINTGDVAKSVVIITEDAEKVEKMIFNDFGRRVTEIYSKGALTNESMKMLVCIAKPREMPKIINRSKEIDEKAFIFVYDVYEVFGKGFKLYNNSK